MTWLIQSPSGVLHAVKSERLLRDLCKAEGLSYDLLAKHVGHKAMDRGRQPPQHVKGWRELKKSQFLQRGDTIVCVSGANATEFIKLANSVEDHPLYGAFTMEDSKRLAHLLNSQWIWSNCQKVNHMHGWTLLQHAPAHAEQLMVHVAQGSPYAPVHMAAERHSNTVLSGASSREVRSRPLIFYRTQPVQMIAR